jgi:hypothetical protein
MIVHSSKEYSDQFDTESLTLGLEVGETLKRVAAASAHIFSNLGRFLKENKKAFFSRLCLRGLGNGFDLFHLNRDPTVSPAT